MAVRKDIGLDAFCIAISPPSNRLASLFVNIHPDGKFNMNGKLAEKLGSKKVSIRFTEDCNYLCLLEEGDIQFPKSGSCKIPEIAEILKKKGIPFPAHYEVAFNSAGKYWLGVREENPIKQPSKKARSIKKQSSS